MEQNRTCRKFRQVRLEGLREVEREIDNYNLDVIISVGYRVKSQQGTQFRIWATQRLKEYIIKAFEKALKKSISGLFEGLTIKELTLYTYLPDNQINACLITNIMLFLIW